MANEECWHFTAEFHILTGLRRPAAALIAFAWSNEEIATGGQLASELIRIQISHLLKERTETLHSEKWLTHFLLHCKYFDLL